VSLGTNETEKDGSYVITNIPISNYQSRMDIWK